MSEAVGSRPVRSLAAIGPGETVVVRCILFDSLRSLCAELDLREGDIVSCRATTPTQLLLEKPNGQGITLRRDRARFIQVSQPAGPLPLRARHAAGEAATA